MASSGMERLFRPGLGALGGYTPGKSLRTLEGEVEAPVEGIIKLNSNENPYGCSPRVQQALAACHDLHLYPDSGQRELRQQLEEYTGIGVEHIVAGNGSDEPIDLVLQLFVEPGDEVINCIPTFDMFRFRTEMRNGRVVEVARDENFAVNINAVKAAITKRTKIIIVANPNSPTGTGTPKKDILELVATGIPVLIDEAYYEFGGETVAPLVSRYENLMVVRTFSKWAGLAGLRAGYGIFPTKIADYLLKIKLPFSVSMAALVAVLESLRDIDYLLGRVRAIVAERARLFDELGKLDFLKPYPSRANFVFCSVLNGKASELQQKLQQKGILVRYFDKPGLRDYIRISVGKPEHTDALIKALQELGGELNG